MSPFPSFYDPRRIGALFHPDMARITAEADAAGLPPASQDATRVHPSIPKPRSASAGG